MIVYAWEQKEWDFLVGLELFLQVYSEFEGGEVPTRENVRKILYWYVNDYCHQYHDAKCKAGTAAVGNCSVNFFITHIFYLFPFYFAPYCS